MLNVTMYGIKNCDTIKKAKKWLEANEISYVFHDYRQQGLSETWLREVLDHHDWEIILNKRGTTYRQLSDDIKNSLDKESAISQLLEHPAMIKRPILEVEGNYYVGFKDAAYQEIFNV
jgi:arsenate reductase (glutaredoxin)